MTNISTTPAVTCNCNDTHFTIDNHDSFSDRPGADYKQVIIGSSNFTLCENACCDDQVCLAWVFAVSAPADFGGFVFLIIHLLRCHSVFHCDLSNGVSPVSVASLRCRRASLKRWKPCR